MRFYKSLCKIENIMTHSFDLSIQIINYISAQDNESNSVVEFGEKIVEIKVKLGESTC